MRRAAAAVVAALLSVAPSMQARAADAGLSAPAERPQWLLGGWAHYLIGSSFGGSVELAAWPPRSALGMGVHSGALLLGRTGDADFVIAQALVRVGPRGASLLWSLGFGVGHATLTRGSGCGGLFGDCEVLGRRAGLALSTGVAVVGHVSTVAVSLGMRAYAVAGVAALVLEIGLGVAAWSG